MNHSEASVLTLRTTWGAIRVVARDGRLVSCALPIQRSKRREDPPKVLSASIRARNREDRDLLRHADRFIRLALKGRPSKCPPLALHASGAFRREAWEALRAVPAGETITYGELARRAGSPRAARAAGSACAQNPLPLFVPCHRVCSSDGSLGGYSAGLAWKRWLLHAERDG